MNTFLENWHPEEYDVNVFTGFGRTLSRLGVVEFMSMNRYANDSGCSDPECCGPWYEQCDVSLKVNGRFIDYEIYNEQED